MKDRNEPQGPLPTTYLERAETPARRPKSNLRDPLLYYAAMQAKGISLCAFLVTLAAFQRGLKVTFYYERASIVPRPVDTKTQSSQNDFIKGSNDTRSNLLFQVQGHRGELFGISNGKHSHIFSRTLGDLTDRTANAISEDKIKTKAVLNKAGIRTPKGIVVKKTEIKFVEKYLAQQLEKRFVVKPYNGSLSKGVEADLSPEEVIVSINKHSGPVILEEYIVGTEYRATVVNGRCIAVSRRLTPSVSGDGKSSIRELLQRFNSTTDTSPYWSGVKIGDVLTSHLLRQGWSLASIPCAGVKVSLSNLASGCQHEDVSDIITDTLKNAAMSAASAIGLTTSGIDVILTASGEPVILELNQRPHIGLHSFPNKGSGQNNAVAEAIIDYYFPETIHYKTYPFLAYNFASIRAVLESAQVTELSLPVIGPDWRVIRIPAISDAAKPIVSVIESAARVAGIFVMSAPTEKGGVDLCIASSPASWDIFMGIIPAQLRSQFERDKANSSNG